jgi:hypothetical protein
LTDGERIITIPRANPVDAFTMAGIVKDAGLTVGGIQETVIMPVRLGVQTMRNGDNLETDISEFNEVDRRIRANSQPVIQPIYASLHGLIPH